MSKKLHIAYDLFDLLYPVGSIYMSTERNSDTVDVVGKAGCPIAELGGTWERIQGKFLLAANDAYTDYQAGATGGHVTTTLTTDNLPAHTHGSKSLVGEAWNFTGQDATYGPGVSHSGIISAAGDSSYYYPTSKSNSTKGKDGIKVNATHEHSSVGKGTAFNTMPPFIAIYTWKRTA